MGDWDVFIAAVDVGDVGRADGLERGPRAPDVQVDVRVLDRGIYAAQIRSLLDDAGVQSGDRASRLEDVPQQIRRRVHQRALLDQAGDDLALHLPGVDEHRSPHRRRRRRVNGPVHQQRPIHTRMVGAVVVVGAVAFLGVVLLAKALPEIDAKRLDRGRRALQIRRCRGMLVVRVPGRVCKRDDTRVGG